MSSTGKRNAASDAEPASAGGMTSQAQWPAIIKAASRSSLGITALACLVLGGASVALFWTSADVYKLAAFGVLIVAVATFVIAVLRLRPSGASPEAESVAPTAVAAPPEREPAADVDVRPRIREWSATLLAIQHESGGLRTSVHDAAGRVQVWGTAVGVVGVLAAHRGRSLAAEDARRVRDAFKFIEKRRNVGGVEGWGLWDDPPSKSPCTVVDAWVAVAGVESLRAEGLWLPEQSAEMRDSIVRTLDHLLALQDPAGGAHGGWCPSTPVRAENTRTYATVMSLWAIAEAERAKLASPRHTAAAERAVAWLLHHWAAGAGWRENPNRIRSRTDHPSLTAQALYVLDRSASGREYLAHNPQLRDAKAAFLSTAMPKLLERDVSDNEQMDSGDQSLCGTSEVIEGSKFLWYPWALAALKSLADDGSLTSEQRERADKYRRGLLERAEEADELIADGSWAMAEALHGIAVASMR